MTNTASEIKSEQQGDRKFDLRHRSGRALKMSAGGMSLIELLTVVAAVAILLAIAVPGFSTLTQKNKILQEINGFANDVRFARSEAIKRGQIVSICASNNGMNCNAGDDWEKGWIVFADNNGDQVLDTGEQILRVRSGFKNSHVLSVSPTSTSVFSYTRDGFAQGLSRSLVFTLGAPVADDNTSQCMRINLAGKQQIYSPSGGVCS